MGEYSALGTEGAAGVERYADICYHPDGSNSADVFHHLDVYAPKLRSEPLPTVIFLHGGGWRRGDRRSALGFHQNVGEALAREGFVAVLPSYRKACPFPPWLLGLAGAGTVYALLVALARAPGKLLLRAETQPEVERAVGVGIYVLFAYTIRQLIRMAGWGVRHPKHTEDCAMAISWAASGGVRAYGGDPQRLVIAGQSAGAHMAALLALPSTGFLSKSIKSKNIRGLIAISGIYSGHRFRTNWLHYVLYSYVFDGATDFESCFAVAHCDQRHQTQPNSGAHSMASMCPTLLVNASFDVGLQSHAFEFAEVLRQCGAKEVEGPHVIDGTDHFTMMPRVGCKGLVDRELIPQISSFVHRVCST